ncbi:hypothetical protein RRG08_004241 [Elysia crispata]|uniref:Uncharacterized protein n=1 Tax=Elysia crispata TaxID=231223 RepID=A0AAE0ZT10_9GAST|nr:hypothetical protein RRG08_004241 [Elysia crispata]
MRLSELKETTSHGLRWNNSPTAQQFTEGLDRMLHTPVTSLITSQATARPMWSIMLFGLWPLPSPLQLPNVEEKLYGEKYVWFSIGWYLDNW